jgi:hypothetical protein
MSEEESVKEEIRDSYIKSKMQSKKIWMKRMKKSKKNKTCTKTDV